MATKTVTPTREAINATMAYGRERQRPGLKPEQETAAGALLSHYKECNDRGSQGISLLQMKQGYSAIDRLTHTLVNKQAVTSSYHVEMNFFNDGNDVTSK